VSSMLCPAVIPSQLATRALPEMELQEAAYLKDYPTAGTAQSAVEKSLVDLCNLPDAHNRLISAQFEAGAKPGPVHEKVCSVCLSHQSR
jgi:hypothetical protein